MNTFEIEQRRAGRQMKCYRAGEMVRELMGISRPQAGSTREAIEQVRQAALSAVAEARATMHLLVLKGIASDAEVQDALDWGYDSLLQQIGDGGARKVLEAGHG